MESRLLLTITAVTEIGAGLALTASPSVVSTVLLGLPIQTPAGLTVGRVAGFALLSLGLACWLMRGNGAGHTATALVTSLVLYNVAVAAVLALAGLCYGLFGIALWPAVALHAVLAIWCAVYLWGAQR